MPNMAKHPLFRSFGFAFKGLALAFKERNFRLHLVSAALVVMAGLYCGVSATEWMLLLICTAAVLSLELMNTALEKLCDLASPGLHPLAGAAKDLAAAAVLVFSIVSAIVAAMIFIPYFFN